MRKKIVIIGSSFAGYTAALELADRIERAHDITVISKSADFVFLPSLIWLPFGERTADDITFPIGPVYADKGIELVQAAVTRIDLAEHRVEHNDGSVEYDYLIIASGTESDWSAIPGLGPSTGFTESIFGLEDAEHAAVAFERYLEAPGPVVIGAVHGATTFGPVYEFLFNFAHQMKRRDRDVLITYLTYEPFVGFGIGADSSAREVAERLFLRERIEAITNVHVAEVRAHQVVLADGHKIPFAYAMLAPPVRGIHPVRCLTEIVDERGFVIVDDYFQTAKYPEVFAAGVAVSIAPSHAAGVPDGVATTGYLAEEMGKVVAYNVAAMLSGTDKRGFSAGAIDGRRVIDAGDHGLVRLPDHLRDSDTPEWLIPGADAHWAKLALEKYFLATHRRGEV